MFRWFSLLLLTLPACAVALAQEPPWYRGLPLVQVSIEAPEGLADGENLQPLLLSVQGEPYRPADVRADLQMLHAVGAFTAVEAHVERSV